MDDIESLAHTRWECKYHVVWIPKYRRKALYGELRKYLGPVFRDLAQHHECTVEERTSGGPCMLVSIPRSMRWPR
jgi:putative transposase